VKEDTQSILETPVRRGPGRGRKFTDEQFLELYGEGLNDAEVGRRLGKSRPYVSTRVRLLKLHPSLREAVRQRTITPDHAHALLRLEEPEQLALAEEVQAEGLSVHETRKRVRQMLGKEFRWRLVPVRLSLDTYEALQRIAPEGNIKRLIQETIEKLFQT